jgi:hypothetical protein
MPRVRGRPPNKLGKSASASASSPVGGERFASRSRRVLSSGEGKKSSLISWQSGTCCRLVIKSLQPSPRGRLSTRPGRSRSRRAGSSRLSRTKSASGRPEMHPIRAFALARSLVSIDFGPPADWLGFLDFHSKRRYAPLDLRNTGSSGSDGPHLPAGRMSRGPHSYRHQRRLTTLSISHWCTFAMADARSAVRQKTMLRGGVKCSTR